MANRTNGKAAMAKAKTNSRPTVQVGVTGLKHIAGRVYEEYLSILKSWSNEVKVYLEMRDDDIIGTLLDALKLPLLSADFDVIPGGDRDGDSKARDFLWENMNGMHRQAWRSHVQDALESLDFGFAVDEMVLEKRKDGRLWLKNIDPRGQETLWEWKFEDDEVVEFRQRNPITGEMYDIPLSKCIHMTFRGRKGNPQGKSLLRSVFRPWRFLKNMEDLEGIGVERDVGGMPVFTMPEEPLSDADETKIDDALKGMRMDEEMFLRIPAGSELKAYGGGTKMFRLNDVIERKKKQILMRVFAQFLMGHPGPLGGEAMIKGSTDFFTLGLVAIQQQMLEAWNQQLVPYLFNFNHFAGMTDLPRIDWAKPGKVDIGAFMQAYTQGVTSQLITPIREDEERARDILDLPELPEGEGEGPRDVETMPAPGIFSNMGGI